MAKKFRPNPAAVRKIGLSPQMKVMVATRTEAAAAETRRVAPVGDSPEGQHYRDQIRTYIRRLRNRWVGRVNAEDFKSHWIEFGTRATDKHAATPAFAPLRKGLAILGLRFKTREKSGGKLGRIQGGPDA